MVVIRVSGQGDGVGVSADMQGRWVGSRHEHSE